MNRIRVLSPQVANQIAAGEVVERPASVVKELVENAIDAGATAITVEIENGGVDYIRVADNGSGIAPEDCKTAFLRHATSKISAADDISHIHTLGFRGEALASIASVSQVCMKTRVANAESGTMLRIDNGEFLEHQPCACAEGTVMEVRGLFAQIPARLKFLKSARAEAGYIGDYVARMIMALPQVSFHYINNGKTVYRTYGDGILKNAVFSIYGASVMPHLRELFFDDGYLRITGYVGTAEIARPNRIQQSVFLNSRYIRSAAISNAMSRAYDTRLMSGRFPFAVIFLRIASTEVDVNVHPTKMEVRFSDDRRVVNAVYSACVRALEAVPRLTGQAAAQLREDDRIPETSSDSGDTSGFGDITAALTGVSAHSPVRPYSGGLRASAAVQSGAGTLRETFRSAGPPMPPAPAWSRDAGTARAELDLRSTPQTLPCFQIKRQEPSPAADMTPEKDFGAMDYRIIGAAFSGYWIVEQGDALFFIDQHAAHERRLYEKLMSRELRPVSQSLLVPERLTLPAAEMALLLEHRAQLEELGFSFEIPAGEDAVTMTAVPMIDGSPLDQRGLYDALEQLRQAGRASARELQRERLIQTACKHAVKVNERISPMEIQRLLAEYEAQGVPMTCPHGRPVMVRMTKLELEKLFKRVL